MHALSRIASALLMLASTRDVLARPAARDTCTSPAVRREWREFTEPERLEYIDAILCMQSSEGKTPSLYLGVKSRYDDFVALHISMTDYIHWVGHFLPWHRNFLYLFEQDLRITCGYNGTIPYWDWTKDASAGDDAILLSSPVFDTTTGFGGNGLYDEDTMRWVNGTVGGGCVTDGPFANYTVSMGPGAGGAYNPHCLKRDISSFIMYYGNSVDKLEWTLNASTFFEFEYRTEGTIQDDITAGSVHGGGHLGLGGDMANAYSSPSDPLFFPHHGALDRMWNTWQRHDWDTRKAEIGGPDTQGAYPFNLRGPDTPYQNVTLDYVLAFGEISSNKTIADLMDIESAELCYTYS